MGGADHTSVKESESIFSTSAVRTTTRAPRASVQKAQVSSSTSLSPQSLSPSAGKRAAQPHLQSPLALSQAPRHRDSKDPVGSLGMGLLGSGST